MGMGSTRQPRALVKGGLVTTSASTGTWNLVLDISAGDDDRQKFENHSLMLVNLDGAIDVDISIDAGATTLCRLTPSRAGRTYDFFGLPSGKVWEKHASGQPVIEVTAWA